MVAPDVSGWSGVRLEWRVEGGHRNEVWSGHDAVGRVSIRRSRRSPASLAWELDLLAKLDRAGFLVPTVMPTDAGRMSADGIVVQRWIDGREPTSTSRYSIAPPMLRPVAAPTPGKRPTPGWPNPSTPDGASPASTGSMASVGDVDGGDFSDFIAAPNISTHPDVYELENAAIQRDGRLDQALFEIAPWTDATLIDLGCGTGFWLPSYAERARRVIGVEPDPTLFATAIERTGDLPNIEVRRGSAEHLPLDDHSADIVHARFSYFFGEGADAGLAEVLRVLRPGGVFVAVDNSWDGGDFAQLLRCATTGNAAIDPERTVRWWADRGAERHEVIGGWSAESADELERILKIEFPPDVVDDFLQGHAGSDLSYHFALSSITSPD